MRAPSKPKWKFGPWSRPDKEWLYDQYITQDKSARQIAREVGAHHTTILDWLVRLEIPFREVKPFVDKLTPKGIHQRGDKHYAWVGGNRGYAYRLMLRLGVPRVCASCGFAVPDLVVHHKDGNPNNNAPENLEWLCRSCHYYAHEYQAGQVTDV